MTLMYTDILKNTFGWTRTILTGCILFMSGIVSVAQTDSTITKRDTLITPEDVEELNTINPDTLQTTSHEGVDLIKPRKAMFRSMMLPGLGQAYNKKYWKIPLVYAAFGGVIYAIDFNTTGYRIFRDAYIAEIDGLDHPYKGRVNAQTLKNERDRYRKNMELSYIGLVAVYGLNILDAFVDGHLKSFEVSEDISLKVKPTVLKSTYSLAATVTPGISCSFTFKSSGLKNIPIQY